MSALPTALLGVLLFSSLALLGISPTIRLVVVLGYGLLTPAFAYANAFYGHQLSAALLFAAFYLTLHTQGKLSISQLLCSGLLLGYSVITEYPTVLMAGIIFLYTFYWLQRQGRWAHIFYVMLTGGIVAVGWMLYNTLIFGGPLSLGYEHSELWTGQHETGFMSLTMPHWDALWGITFGQFRGLFTLSPWLILALPGLFFWWRAGQSRSAWWTSVACILSMGLFNASSGMWWGGFAVGPRYLLPALPFLAVGTAFAFMQWQNRRWFRWIAGLLLCGSGLLVWGLSLAGQAFPPDTLYNPLIEYALPNWQQGNIARNIGTVLGLDGMSSLLPLLMLVAIGSWLLNMIVQDNPQASRPLDLNRESAFAGVARPSNR